MTDLTLTLPWPPSVNRYWRNVHGMMKVSQEGRHYRELVKERFFTLHPSRARLAIEINVLEPDRRKRDLDNLLKAVLDACTYAGIWEDDSQIDSLAIHRAGFVPNGHLEMTVKEKP